MNCLARYDKVSIQLSPKKRSQTAVCRIQDRGKGTDSVGSSLDEKSPAHDTRRPVTQSACHEQHKLPSVCLICTWANPGIAENAIFPRQAHHAECSAEPSMSQDAWFLLEIAAGSAKSGHLKNLVLEPWCIMAGRPGRVIALRCSGGPKKR